MNAPLPRSAPGHPAEVCRVHRQLMADAGLTDRTLRTGDGAGVHVIDKGEGTPVLMIHGSGSPGLFWLPLLQRLDGRRTLVVDRPGFGLSDPSAASLSPSGSVAWISDVLDALELSSAVIVGHSMGGLWALCFARACPQRVRGLVMLGTPSLPGTKAPLPFRLLGTPGLRVLITRQRETPSSFCRFAAMVGEGNTIRNYPQLVDLMVAVGDDPVAKRAILQEVGAVVSPWALVSRTGFRRRIRMSEADLRELAVPTLLLWGNTDPVGSGDVARRVQQLIPGAGLEVVDGGHAPWLGQSTTLATALLNWVQRLDA